MFNSALKLWILIQFIRAIISSYLMNLYLLKGMYFGQFFIIFFGSILEDLVKFIPIYVPLLLILCYRINNNPKNSKWITFQTSIIFLLFTIWISYILMDDFPYYFNFTHWFEHDNWEIPYFSGFRTPGFIISYSIFPLLLYFIVVRKKKLV